MDYLKKVSRQPNRCNYVFELKQIDKEVYELYVGSQY